MKIPQQHIDKWKALRDHGDIVKIAKESGFSENTVSAAFIKKECNERLFNKISDFYNKRESRLKLA